MRPQKVISHTLGLGFCRRKRMRLSRYLKEKSSHKMLKYLSTVFLMRMALKRKRMSSSVEFQIMTSKRSYARWDDTKNITQRQKISQHQYVLTKDIGCDSSGGRASTYWWESCRLRIRFPNWQCDLVLLGKTPLFRDIIHQGQAVYPLWCPSWWKTCKKKTKKGALRWCGYNQTRSAWLIPVINQGRSSPAANW